MNKTGNPATGSLTSFVVSNLLYSWKSHVQWPMLNVELKAGVHVNRSEI